MTNQEVATFQGGLQSVSNFAGLKFANAVARNKSKIKRYIQDRDTEINKKVDMTEYSKLDEKINKIRIDHCEKYCLKKKDGSPDFKMEGGRPHYQFEDQGAFEELVTKAIGEDKKILDDWRKERANLVQEWNKKDSTIELYMIPESYLPETINATQIESIIWMVTELVEDLLEDSSKKIPKGKGKKLTKS